MTLRDRRVGRVVDVASLVAFDALVAGGARRMAGWRVREVDLTGRTAALLALDPGGALVLGCALEPAAAAHLRHGGAVVLPAVPDVPIDPSREGLYTPEELYGPLAAGAGTRYEDTLDARVYAWSQSPGDDPAGAVAGALHDATGGGPGAMEAANLGARLATAPDAALDGALQILAAVPSYRPSVGAWAAAAFAVRRRWPGGDGGVGVPTWFYGHEPPNPFADRIAKFLQNSVREATLLERANAGIVFLPGAAGTVQEIFQDACENFYADRPKVAPMVLVGVEHWTVRLPAWPLLRALAAGRAMDDRIHLVDDPADAVGRLELA